MSDTQKLHEKRASLLTEAQSIVKAAADAGEALNAESQARFDKLTAEAQVVAAAIRSEKEADEARAAADAARAEFAAVIAPKVDEKRDLNAEFRAIARDGGTIELRTIDRADFTQGVTQGDRFWITAAAYNPFLNADIVDVMLQSTGNTLALPRTTALGTAGSVSEGGSIGQSDGTNSSLSLTPVKYANLVAIGLETVNDEAFNVAAWATEKLAAEIAQAHGAVAGTAVAAQATVGKTGDAAAPSVSDLTALVYSVNARFRRSPKAGFLMNDATLAGIIGLVDDQNRPIFVPGDLNRADSIYGYPVHGAQMADTAADALSVLFGDLGAIKTVVVAPGATIESSREYLFANGQVAYRGYVRGATGLIDGAAVKAFKGVAA